ncbi:MAG TPA: hypothetical protein VJS66_07845 [Burkholderiales bacterium]|nr:hypothetical protein [Burkholderiales bacterium]
MSKAGNSAVASATTSIGYIVSPCIDFWMTGGASIVAMCVLLAYIALHGVSESSSKAVLLGNMIVFQAIINWPHFMGAYSLLYRPSENIKKYPFASIYVPMVLVAIVVLSVLTGDHVSWSRVLVNQDIAYLFWLAAAFYLAWHYTGQAWGMIATFSRLSNTEIMPIERFAIRIGLRLLLMWHVVWGAQDLPAHWLIGLHPYLPSLLTLMSVLCGVAFAAGIVVWLRVAKRMGAVPDARILASWVAIYLWYLVLNFMPEAYPIVQLSHALQYLPFPLRVELNRATSLASTAERVKSMTWSAKYYVALIVAGLVVFYLPEAASDRSQQYTFAVMIASAVSIHHYFVDGCIWRISNADIRRNLFAHLSLARLARA